MKARGRILIATSRASLCRARGTPRPCRPHRAAPAGDTHRASGRSCPPGVARPSAATADQRRPGEKPVVRFGLVEQRFDLFPQRGILATGVDEKRRALGCRPRARRVIQLIDLCQRSGVIRLHGDSPRLTFCHGDSPISRSATVPLKMKRGLSPLHFLNAHFAPQPGSRQPPVTHHRIARHFEDRRGLLDAQPAEEPQLDDAALSFVELGERFQRVSSATTSCRFVADDELFVERHLAASPPRF